MNEERVAFMCCEEVILQRGRDNRSKERSNSIFMLGMYGTDFPFRSVQYLKRTVFSPVLSYLTVLSENCQWLSLKFDD